MWTHSALHPCFYFLKGYTAPLNSEQFIGNASKGHRGTLLFKLQMLNYALTTYPCFRITNPPSDRGISQKFSHTLDMLDVKVSKLFFTKE